jgi:8-oxo-dGTP pyrophosphatase MutT (NUDIX family)
MPTPQYILDLRSAIGSRFLLTPTVTAAIFNDDGKMLVVRIADRAEEFWSYPGGIIEPDERPIEAVQREVLEETGLHVEVVDIIGMYSGPEFRHTYSNGDQVGFVMGSYLCNVVGGTEQPDGDEISELRWVTLEEALKLPCSDGFPIVTRDAFTANDARNRRAESSFRRRRI